MGSKAGNTGGIRHPVNKRNQARRKPRVQLPYVLAAGVKPTAGGVAGAALVGVPETGVAPIPSLLTTAVRRWG